MYDVLYIMYTSNRRNRVGGVRAAENENRIKQELRWRDRVYTVTYTHGFIAGICYVFGHMARFCSS